jgi:hypothetical protein
VKTLTTILFAFICICAKSQINISYSLGSIGGNMKTSTYSNPILINGENCIKVTNSISKFTPSKTGDFYSTCSVNIDFTKIQIKLALAPNPVNTYTIVRAYGKVPNDTKFNVMIFNNTGQPVYATEATQQQILTGFKMNLANLATGIYFVQVSSSSVLETIKFLKN